MFTAISSPILPLAPTPQSRTDPTQTTTRAIEPATASNGITPGTQFSVHPPDTTTRATALDNGPLRSSTPEDRARRQAASAEPQHLFEAVVQAKTPATEPPVKAYEDPAVVTDPTRPVAVAHPKLRAVE
jgi:hypothetical protein